MSWKRIEVQHLAFNGIVIESRVTLTMPKYGVASNKPETRCLFMERAYIEKMIERLGSRGWSVSKAGLKTTLILEEQ